MVRVNCGEEKKVIMSCNVIKYNLDSESHFMTRKRLNVTNCISNFGVQYGRKRNGPVSFNISPPQTFNLVKLSCTINLMSFFIHSFDILSFIVSL